MGPRTFTILAGICLVAPGLCTQARAADPFAPRPLGTGQVRAPSGPTALRLDGVLITPYAREAVINGRTLAPGESIAGARLLALSPGSAVLVRNRRRITLVLAPDPRRNAPDRRGSAR